MRAIAAVQPAWGAEVHPALDALLHDILVVLVAGIALGGVDGNVNEVIVNHGFVVCHRRGCGWAIALEWYGMSEVVRVLWWLKLDWRGWIFRTDRDLSSRLGIL